MPLPTDQPAHLTLDQLREGFCHRYDDLWALEVEHSDDTRIFDGDEETIPFGKCHFAFSGEQRYKAQSGPCLGDSFIFPHYVWAWNGQSQQVYVPEYKNAYLEAQKNSWTDSDVYLETAGIPVGSHAEEWARFRGTCCIPWIYYFLNESELRWEVASRLEIVDGAACHVVQSGDKRFWIDPEIGFGVRFRETYRRISIVPFKARRPLNRCALLDYRHVGNRIWLPWRLEVSCYSMFGQLAWESLREVEALSINEDVPGSLFYSQFPPGTVVRDSVQKRFYRIDEQGNQVDIGASN
jgi:hypothetical protein